MWLLTLSRFIWKTRSFRAVGPQAAQSFDARNSLERRQCSDQWLYHYRNRTKVSRASRLRAIAQRFGVSGVLADPVLSLYNSSGTLIATNDNWQTDIGADLYAAKWASRQPIHLNRP